MNASWNEVEREVLDLLDAMCEGTLSNDQRRRLHSLLAEHREVVKLYCEYVFLTSTLRWSHTGADVVLPAEVVRPRQTTVLGFLGQIRSTVNRPVVWSILGVGVLFASYFLVISWNMLSRKVGGERQTLAGGANSGPAASSLESDSAAAIRNSVDAQWSRFADDSAIAFGEVLQLNSGLVELQLMEGARLLIEGPAEWKIDGKNAATLTKGRLVATVPRRAVGFILDTPTSRIVDLGTEFGVEVGGDGVTEVFVKQGQVTTTPTRFAGGKSPESVRLTTGQSVLISSTEVKPVESNPSKFVGKLPNSAAEAADFTPDKLAGLRLWLRSDRGVTIDDEGHVQCWRDLAGNTYDAVQTDPAKRPRFQSVGEGPGLPTVQFDGDDDSLSCTRGLDFDLSGDLTIFVALSGFQKFQQNVGIFSIRSRGGIDWNCLDGLAIRQAMLRGNPIVGVVQASNKGWATMPGFDDLRAESQVPPQGAIVISVTKQDGVATVRINGNTTDVDEYQFGPVAGKPSQSESGYVLGTRLSASTHIKGAVQIAEVLVYDRALAGREGARADAYLLYRYVSTQSKFDLPTGGGKVP